MTGGDGRCWSLTLLELKLNGQINRCCHFAGANHQLASAPIRLQHLGFDRHPHLSSNGGWGLFSLSPACFHSIAKEKYYKNDRIQVVKSFKSQYFTHAPALRCRIPLQGDVKHGKLSQNLI